MSIYVLRQVANDGRGGRWDSSVDRLNDDTLSTLSNGCEVPVFVRADRDTAVPPARLDLEPAAVLPRRHSGLSSSLEALSLKPEAHGSFGSAGHSLWAAPPLGRLLARDDHRDPGGFALSEASQPLPLGFHAPFNSAAPAFVTAPRWYSLAGSATGEPDRDVGMAQAPSSTGVTCTLTRSALTLTSPGVAWSTSHVSATAVSKTAVPPQAPAPTHNCSDLVGLDRDRGRACEPPAQATGTSGVSPHGQRHDGASGSVAALSMGPFTARAPTSLQAACVQGPEVALSGRGTIMHGYAPSLSGAGHLLAVTAPATRTVHSWAADTAPLDPHYRYDRADASATLTTHTLHTDGYPQLFNAHGPYGGSLQAASGASGHFVNSFDRQVPSPYRMTGHDGTTRLSNPQAGSTGTSYSGSHRGGQTTVSARACRMPSQAASSSKQGSLGTRAGHSRSTSTASLNSGSHGASVVQAGFGSADRDARLGVTAGLVVHEPSVCIPWVSADVGRELVVSTFEQFGTVMQVGEQPALCRHVPVHPVTMRVILCRRCLLFPPSDLSHLLAVCCMCRPV